MFNMRLLSQDPLTTKKMVSGHSRSFKPHRITIYLENKYALPCTNIPSVSRHMRCLNKIAEFWFME